MKKYILALIILFALPVTVFAHEGNTDGAGGHYNHSTGEYHYHHGQPEHDHYDMDGDGDIDCPYRYNESHYDPPKPAETEPPRYTIPDYTLPTVEEFDFVLPAIEIPEFDWSRPKVSSNPIQPSVPETDYSSYSQQEETTSFWEIAIKAIVFIGVFGGFICLCFWGVKKDDFK